MVLKVHKSVPSIDCGYPRGYGAGHDGPCPQVRVPLLSTTSMALLLGPSQEWKPLLSMLILRGLTESGQ